MIDKFIELSQVCDLKAIQEESKSLTVNSIDDVKGFFANKNLEITDRLANELIERSGMQEMSIDELSTVSAGTKYYGMTRDKCPLCGNETYIEWFNEDEGQVHKALYSSERQLTICDTPYYEWTCTKCGAEFTFWVNEGYAEY